MVTINHGSFVISLDFELFWGVKDSANTAYKQNILGVHHVFPEILELFSKYNINATVATVGFLFFKDKTELLLHLPHLKPTYIRTLLSPYDEGFIKNVKEEDSELFFAPQLINLLKKQDNVEIGTHTFCHYYCWEKGQTIEQFEADIQAAVKAAKQNGIDLKSIVFPRNHIQEEYLPVLSKYGITSYRGNPDNFYENTTTVFSGLKNRVLRLLDAYINVSSDNLIAYNDIVSGTLPFNIPASRFLRPYSAKLSVFDGIKLNRIKKEMNKAAKEKKIYHLWWHPHNFGINQEKNLAMLEDILKHYKYLNETHDFHSYSMRQLTENLLKQNE